MSTFFQKRVEKAFNHSTIQPFNHSTIQPSNHPIIQSSNQAIKQSSNQATLPCCYNFYKNRLKNPLLFILPPFINPHHIFKPFDSISPIFQSVGLTELNSIQGEDNGKSRSGVKKTLSNFSGC
ncbi:hypothetical protein BZK23_07405 [Helicobacter pylori]|nr:hypothetical protein BZK23_07405 [Helicobacter pylori]